MRPSQAEVVGAIMVILSDEGHYDTTLNYAVNYCKAALGLEPEALRVQCLYILNNIGSWRHSQAKEVRAILRNYSKP